ncbi:P-loop containing nucleoside triphosphate hydrolase protein [Xylaria curta]|nr:P-loop containing nucleoside triphosphate hydrolase protein [Xylaria curta]
MEIVNNGPDKITRIINRMVKYQGDGGTLIIDEAYQLTLPGFFWRSTFDVISTMMEDNVGKLAIVFLGHKDEMESFLGGNPGLSNRIPYTMEFDDFTDYELWKILCKQLTDRYNGRMEIEGGNTGLYMRCAIRRLATGRGRKGFGNARAVNNLLSHVMKRQAQRLVEERRDGEKPNYYLLTKEDLLGPDPLIVQRTSQPLVELHHLYGLKQVKENVKHLIDMININYNRELHELRPIAFSLNQIFVGEPGTRKTTVAKLYGRILADLGYLSRGDADFIGDHLGKSEAQTKRILEASVGKVLVVDEAYMLDPSSTNGDQDKFKSAAIDTIVSTVHGLPFEDRCIILAGYEDKMMAMFRNANPGLSRCFPTQQPFRFENFTSEQLLTILQSKMKDQHLVYTDEALIAANEIFKKELMRGNHTNIGIVDRILEMAIYNYSRRLMKVPFCPNNPNPRFQAIDFNLDGSKRVDYFEAMQGRIDVKVMNRLMSYRDRHWKAVERGRNPEELGITPTRFIFHGSQGTGKLTASHLMAKLFYEFGYLSMPEVVEYSATDLVGQYVGHNGHKMREKLENGFGRLIYIKNACCLLSGSHETQIFYELARFLAQPAHQRGVVIIFGSDTEGVGQLMKRLSLFGIFPEEIAFKNIPPATCMTLLGRELEFRGFVAEFSFLSETWSPDYEKAKKLFSDMQSIPGWANAHDVKHLARQITGQFFELDDGDASKSKAQLSLLVTSCMDKVIKQMESRLSESGSRNNSSPQREYSGDAELKLASSFMELLKYRGDADVKVDTDQITRGNFGHNERATAEAPRIEVKQSQIHHEHRQNEVDEEVAATREEGVADEVWDQLQEAKKIASKKQAAFEGLERRRQEAADAVVRDEGLESDRLRKEYEDINREYKIAQQLIRQKEKIQKVLRKMGRCKYGFAWRHVGGGYRCEGGAHFVSDAEVYKMVDKGE